MNSADNTAKELAAGLIVYGILAQMICLIVADNLLFVSVGLWIGIATALGMMVHMKRSIEDALDFGEEGAPKHMRKAYVVRLLIVAVIFGVTAYFKVGNIIAALIGVMSLKISAYLQPWTHQVFVRLQKSK
ncbi:MAG: hypothetical protein KHZ72_02710 [Lachnospiraceae bacterium]|nr:hypothetical protein [Lachnospiraceae bacterium]